jgi:hypothetical protein
MGEGVARPTEPKVCECVAPGDPGFRPGVVWRGDLPLSLEEIASLLAPVLWFSSDEPLILSGHPAPGRHPCDPEEEGSAVVYWQAPRLRLRGRERVEWPGQEDQRFWEKVHSLSLRYLFYYAYDYGLSPHEHDLEAAEFHVLLETAEDGCYQVRVDRVIGFAHGVDWYSNVLEVQADTKFPITLFIEEGKHAVCPDRNADGIYTPGYDVNQRVHDAWGVRDVLGSGFLIAVSYRSSMTKPRDPAYRLYPPLSELICALPRNAVTPPDKESLLGRYILRAGNQIPGCTLQDGTRLLRYMRTHRMGEDYPPDQPHYDLEDLPQRLTYSRTILPPMSARWDRGPGVAVILPGLDLREGYMVPRLSWSRRDLAVEALFTREAAQFFSWYASAGAGRESIRASIEGGKEWNFVSEMGVKFRVRMTGRSRLFVLGYRFAGVRVGLRNSGFDRLGETRFIVEVGAGVW